MSVHTFTDALHMLDAREQRLGGRPLADADLDWQTRTGEVVARLTCALSPDGPPDLALLSVAGAHLVALWDAAVEAHTTRVESGAEA